MPRHPLKPIAPTGVAVVEVTAPLPSFDFSTARRWDVLVLLRGEPVSRLSFPSPGPVDSAALARAVIWPHAAEAQATREASDRLLDRLGAPASAPTPAPTCSVVLCTHGRPAHLATALEALGALDPAPLEVVVVDNAPGSGDCRDAVERRGFRYVREDRRGLDNARNAGARAARGEVVVFTDDDCVHPAGWLGRVAAGFDDPTVAAVTGPAFAYLLDRPARVRMERQASLTRGLRRRTFDWTLISALQAGQTGVGANMAIRASVLRAVDEPFPPELDAGTETQSGGDTYLFVRLLTAGHRIVYDPAAFIFHQHRDTWGALEAAVTGYGTGTSATLWKLLREDREPEAVNAVLWLVSQYVRTQRRRLAGRADTVETRIAWSYVRGGLRGPRAGRQARATQRAIDPGLAPAPPFPPPTDAPCAPPAAPTPERTRASGAGEQPAVSVVVPTLGRAPALQACLAALDAQTLPVGLAELILVDDSAAQAVVPPELERIALRVHRSDGKGAAAARNAGAELARGELLLFLDDDLVAAPDLLERHLAAHEQAPPGSAVVGCSPPRPPRSNLAALGAALWWEDRFRAMECAAALTFTDALSGNVSIARAVFLDGRRFDARFGSWRREDWEWGLRLLERGTPLRYEPAAIAAHAYDLTAAQRLHAARLEGRGDAVLVGQHPAAAPQLPLAQVRPGGWRHPLRALAIPALGHARAGTPIAALLGLLERARLRSVWSALYRRAQRAAYAHGAHAGGWRPELLPATQPLDVELSSTAPLPPPGAIAPPVRVLQDGEPVVELLPPSWGPELVEQLQRRLDETPLPWPPHAAPPPPDASVTVVLGPARAAGDEQRQAELVANGACMVVLDGAPSAHWEHVLEAAEEATTELIAIPLPGWRPTPTWLAEVAVAFEAPRVALAIGHGLHPSRPCAPLTLHDRAPNRLPYAPLSGPADYVVLRSDALVHLRCAAARAAYGPMAVAFACAQEAIDAGRLVAYRAAHGLEPTSGRWPTPAEQERRKLTAWGALLGDAALARPPFERPAWLAGLAAGAAAMGVRRALRPARLRSASAQATVSSLARGYAAAVRRRDPTGTR